MSPTDRVLSKVPGPAALLRYTAGASKQAATLLDGPAPAEGSYTTDPRFPGLFFKPGARITLDAADKPVAQWQTQPSKPALFEALGVGRYLEVDA